MFSVAVQLYAPIKLKYRGPKLYKIVNILPLKISSFYHDVQFEMIKWYDIFIANFWNTISRKFP